MGPHQDMAVSLETIQQKHRDDIGAAGAELSSLFGWLDRLLARAAAKAEILYGAQAAADPYRGLYINYGEVNRLLDRFAGRPIFESDDDLEWQTLQLEFDLSANGSMAQLAQDFELTSFDLKVILLALAPEVDLRYERLFAYLQDDVTRRYPSVDLALNLFCRTYEDKLARRAHFAPEALLLRHDLIQLFTDTSRTTPALLGHYLKLDEQTTNFLLGQSTIGASLSPFCQIRESRSFGEFIGIAPEVRKALCSSARQTKNTRPLRVFLSGPGGVEKLHAAEMLSAETKLPLLVVDLHRALAGDTDFGRILARVFRHARLVPALVYIEGCDVLHSDGGAIYGRRLREAIRDYDGFVLLAGEKSAAPLQTHDSDAAPDLLEITFTVPEFSSRRECWKHHLAAANLPIVEEDLDLLAGRFRLTSAQVTQAVVHARNERLWRAASASVTAAEARQPNLADICQSARAQSQHQLASLAQKIEPVYGWNDIVVPDEIRDQLRELCSRVAERQRVLNEWGFGRKLSLGRGVSALFAGPSGTGKTMAAEIVAKELQLELYKIDLSRIVSKYIGETEKNLDRIFSTAEDANAILFFDEADALFGKRSEVRDSHDRYANIEVSYLLQKMEQYEGVAILATNLRQNLDDAFLRRLQIVIQFRLPDEDQRRRIWQQLFPAESPRDENIDFDALARQFSIAGGNIKNIVLGSAFLAAANGGRIEMTHVMKSARSEYQKLGKVFSD